MLEGSAARISMQDFLRIWENEWKFISEAPAKLMAPLQGFKSVPDELAMRSSSVCISLVYTFPLNQLSFSRWQLNFPFTLFVRCCCSSAACSPGTHCRWWIRIPDPLPLSRFWEATAFSLLLICSRWKSAAGPSGLSTTVLVTTHP